MCCYVNLVKINAGSEGMKGGIIISPFVTYYVVFQNTAKFLFFAHPPQSVEARTFEPSSDLDPNVQFVKLILFLVGNI